LAYTSIRNRVPTPWLEPVGEVNMTVFQRKSLVYALSAWLGLTAACTSPGYNENPSQQMANNQVGCPVATDFLVVYFSVHVQSARESEEAKITKQLFRSYCHEIPTVGEVFYTIDLAGLEPRKTPLVIQVVEQEPTGFAASLAENFKDLRTIAETAPQRYPKGFVEGSFTADKPGYYAIYLMREGDRDPLRIPLSVGVGSAAWLSIARAASPFGILWLLGFSGLSFVRHRRKGKGL